MLIERAEIAGSAPRSLRIEAGRITAIAPALARRPGEESLDAAGGALLPGLHDHHLHLLSLAAFAGSLRCGPPEVRTREDLERALRGARPRAGWIRGVGYHDSVAGALDRRDLDALAPGAAVRVQHRSGALWILSSAGVDRLGLDRGADAPGVERDAAGRATGRLYRADAWLRERLGAADPPDLGAVGEGLARCGVTGATDATAHNAGPELALLETAAAQGALPQRLLLMGGLELPQPSHPRVTRGAVKLVLAEAELPDFDATASAIRAAHAAGRAAAIHCVTRAELAFAVGAFDTAGARAGDRIEHAAVAPPDLVSRIAALGLTVVAQPSFVRERGDAYAAEVEPADLPWLHRARGFDAAGVPLGGGSDAPFGDPDPWRSMRAAVERRSESGAVLGAEEAVCPERALALFSSPAEAPGAAPRTLAPGAPADLCLLDRPWSEARRALDASAVAATLVAGCVVYRR
ncbi:MAG TPA: amidohydrolase family protein [Myxococcota bacterium]|jgi:predicted amidohydrolase YtcJ